MKQFYFPETTGLLKTSIHLQGDFIIAYSLRLWKSSGVSLELVDDVRGSCFNNTYKEINYRYPSIVTNEFKYFLELDSNISTTNKLSKYTIKLSILQESNAGLISILGEEETTGKVGFNEGGKFSKLGIALNPMFSAKAAG